MKQGTTLDSGNLMVERQRQNYASHSAPVSWGPLGRAEAGSRPGTALSWLWMGPACIWAVKGGRKLNLGPRNPKMVLLGNGVEAGQGVELAGSGHKVAGTVLSRQQIWEGRGQTPVGQLTYSLPVWLKTSHVWVTTLTNSTSAIWRQSVHITKCQWYLAHKRNWGQNNANSYQIKKKKKGAM